MTPQEREITIQSLTQCNLVEFARIIGLALARRPDAQTESCCNRTRLILAQAGQEREDNGSWSRWSTSAIAPADLSHYKREWEFDHGEPFWQFGECTNRHTELCSHAKETICPICGGQNT